MQSTTSLDAISASTVFDEQGKVGALPWQIARLYGEGIASGPVVTVSCAEGSVTGVLAALEVATPGSIVVVQGAGEWAYFGELTGSEAVRVGVAAVIVDGFVRDALQLRELSLAVFARGLTPRGAKFGPPGDVGCALTVGDTVVYPGDWAVGDADGVTIIPQRDVDRVLTGAEKRARREGGLSRSILGGNSLLDHSDGNGGVLRDLLR